MVLQSGLLGGVGKIAGRIQKNILGVQPKTADNLPPGSRRTLATAQFMDTATPTDVVLPATTFTALGDLTDDGFAVPAQQAYRWGYSSPNEGAGHNQGYIFFQLIDDTVGDVTNEDGVARLVVADANQVLQQFVFEERSEELDGDPNDINQRIPLPEQGPLAREDDLLIIRFSADAADTVQPDLSTIRIPSTRYQPVRP